MIISVNFAIHGKDLDPEIATHILKTKPDVFHRRGDRKSGVNGRIYIKKNGYWMLKSRLNDELIDGKHMQMTFYQG